MLISFKDATSPTTCHLSSSRVGAQKHWAKAHSTWEMSSNFVYKCECTRENENIGFNVSLNFLRRMKFKFSHQVHNYLYWRTWIINYFNLFTRHRIHFASTQIILATGATLKAFNGNLEKKNFLNFTDFSCTNFYQCKTRNTKFWHLCLSGFVKFYTSFLWLSGCIHGNSRNSWNLPNS